MTLPIPRIDDIDFEQLVAEAKARIPVHNPDWTHWNDSDPGVTVLELFAFMTESLLYRANRIPERNRVKFLSLLGIGRQPATPAHGMVTFDATKGPQEAVVVAAGAEVRSGSVPFVVDQAIDVLPIEAVVCAKTRSVATIDSDEEDELLDLFPDFDPEADSVFYYDTTRLEIPTGATEYRPIDLAETPDGSLWIALLAPDAAVREDTRDHIGGKVLSLGVLPDVVDAERTLLPRSTRRDQDQPRLNVWVPGTEPLPEPPAPRVPPYRLLSATENADVLVEPGTVAVQLPPAGELVRWEDLDFGELGVGDFPPPLEPDEEDRLVTWLRVRRQAGSSETLTPDAGSSPGLRLAWLGVNAATVTQRKTVVGERLLRGSGAPEQTAQLSNGPVLPATVQVTVNGVAWTQIDDLGSAPAEVEFGANAGLDRPEFATAGTPNVYTCSPDGVIRFGSGLRGARPPRGAVIRASYDFGGGAAGMVPADAISAGTSLPPGVKVTNPIPTWGGRDAESVADAEDRIAEVVQHQNRLVTRDDFVKITRRTPGVDLARVEILPLFHPGVVGVESPGVVTAMVIPSVDLGQPNAPRPDRMFLDTICDHLDAHRLVTTEIHVVGPTYVPVTVSIGFDAQPGAEVPPVREAIREAIEDFLSVLPEVNGNGHGWELQKPLHPLEVLTEAARVSGVRRINGVEMAISGVVQTDPFELSGVELPRLVGLSIQPGDPVPVESLAAGGRSDAATPSRPVLPIPAIPEDC